MTATQFHGALIVAAYVLGTLAALGVASLLVRAIDRSRHIDAVTRYHRAPSTAEQAEGRDIARQRVVRQEAAMRGRPVDDIDAELARLLGEDA